MCNLLSMRGLMDSLFSFLFLHLALAFKILLLKWTWLIIHTPFSTQNIQKKWKHIIPCFFSMMLMSNLPGYGFYTNLLMLIGYWAEAGLTPIPLCPLADCNTWLFVIDYKLINIKRTINPQMHLSCQNPSISLNFHTVCDNLSTITLLL